MTDLNRTVNRGTLVGSWTIVTGDAAFKAFHLYKYEGWTEIDESRMALKKDLEYQQIYKATLPAINEQFNELTKAFSFWPSPDKRVGGNIYDIRFITYSSTLCQTPSADLTRCGPGRCTTGVITGPRGSSFGPT